MLPLSRYVGLRKQRSVKPLPLNCNPMAAFNPPLLAAIRRTATSPVIDSRLHSAVYRFDYFATASRVNGLKIASIGLLQQPSCVSCF
jgi:hypothetical protein